MIRFIHTADIHFGMENYGVIDPKTGIHTRLLDFEKALNHCIDTAIAQDVDLFVFSGDAYKTINPSPTQQRLLMRCLLRLYAAKIPMVIVVGNHDNPLSHGKANTLDIFGDLPLDGFYVIAKPTALKIMTKSGPVQVVGMPWPSRTNIAMHDNHIHKSATALTDYLAKRVSEIITVFAQELDQTIPAILAGHLTVASGIFSGSEKRAIYGNDPTLMVSQLAIKPFDYVALGHLHRYQNLNPNGHPAVVYAGSIERVDFGERKEDKGFCLVTIHSKEHTEHTFIKSPMRSFLQIELHITPERDQTEQLLEALKQYDITNAVVKILYHVPKGKKDMVDLNAIMRACKSAMYIVSITPIIQPESRTARSTMKIDMDMPTLLATYFDSKADCKDKKEQLLEKALALRNELANQEIECCE